MDDENKKVKNQPQNTGGVVREVGHSVSAYATERAPQISEELEKAGVETVSDKPQIDKVNEQMGVRLSLENVPVPSQPATNLILPEVNKLQEEKAKLKPVDSRLWEIEKEIREMKKAA